jgi:hypothetical protein
MNLKSGILLLGAALLIAPAVLFAQLNIDWYSIDGGGGTSTGSVYAVSGTIGQPDADGSMTNGQFSVMGGFWALPIAVQAAGAPTLTISRAAPGLAVVSWTPNTPGFVLQETISLSSTNWINSPSGATNPIMVPALLAKYYRLFKPELPQSQGITGPTRTNNN